MSQAGEDQNINLSIAGAEKVAGATALLQDFSGAVQQLLSNPLGGSYAMNRIAQGFTTAFINPLLKTKQLSIAQRLEFDKMVASGTKVATITGAVMGLSLGMLELMRKTRIASAELTRFFNLGDLPGGVKDLYSGQLELQSKTLNKALEYNEAFASDYERLYKELNRKIKLDMPEIAEQDIESLMEQLALLQKGTGVSIRPFVDLRDDLLSLDIELSDVLYAYKLLMSEVSAEGGAFKEFSHEEAAKIFLNAMNNLREGTSPEEVMRQTFTFMETYADKLGPGQFPKLQALVPGIQNRIEKNVKAQQILGLTPKDLAGSEAVVNVLESMRKFMHERVTGGEKIKNIMEAFRKAPGGVTLLEALDLDKNMLQQINSLEKVDKIATHIADAMDKWRVRKDVMDDTDNMKTTVEKIGEALKNSQSVLELFGTLFDIGTIEARKFSKETLGFELPEWIPSLMLMLGGGALIGRKVLKPLSYLKNLKNIPTPPAGGPPGVSGGGVAPKGIKTPKGRSTGKFGKIGGGLSTIALTLALMYEEEIQEGIGTAVSDALDWLGISSVRSQQAKYKPLSSKEQDRLKQLQKNYSKNGSVIPADISKEYEDLRMRSLLFANRNQNTLQGTPMGGLDVATDFIFDKIFGGGKETVPEKLLAMTPAHTPSIAGEMEEKLDKDLPNLNIIIYNADGDVLASETLQDAVKQGAISIVMEGIVGVK